MSKNKRAESSLPNSFSQNFLTSGRTINRMLDRTSLNCNDSVIEIGTGKGHLTRELVKRCGSVTSYEIDRKLFQAAKEKFADFSSLSLVHMDFMKASLPRKGEYKIFANIPFFLTTDIIRKITQTQNPPKEAWLIVEKGATKRFAGKPCHTLSSLLLKPYYDLDIVYHIDRKEFHPMPSVECVLLHFRKKDQPDLAVSERSSYGRFLTHSFDITFSENRRY